ncbi:MAG: tRNA guanosine(34) transglycosylase Tgt [Rhodospirillales bacterium]
MSGSIRAAGDEIASATDTPGIGFRLLATDGEARRGRLLTAHGAVETPAFMPVGTAATVKALTPEMLHASGTAMLLANTYHLMLRPGAERVARLGGLHRMMRWPGPILTDSGGFQVMSLTSLCKIDDDGVTFQSHIDGSRHRLDAERAVEIQRLLDADISMVLDECIRLPAPLERVEDAMQRSLRWAARSKVAFHQRPGYGLFGIVQGGTDPELRQRCAGCLTALGFDGYAIGGLAVGESQAAMLETIAATVPALPADRPRYLMGVGKPADLVGAVARGIDLFDCVMPTRSGRTGQAFVTGGPINLRNARHADDRRPLDTTIPCPASRDYARGYLHHLVRSNEILGAILLSWSNVAYYQQLMGRMRDAIAQGTFARFLADFAQEQAAGDIARD